MQGETLVALLHYMICSSHSPLCMSDSSIKKDSRLPSLTADSSGVHMPMLPSSCVHCSSGNSKFATTWPDLFCFFCVPSFQISQGQQQVGTRCNLSRFSVKLVHRTDTPKWQQQEQMRHQHAQQQLPRGLSCKFTYLFFPSMMVPECNTTFFISESLFPPIRRFLRSRYSPTADNKSSVELYIDLLFYAGTYHTLCCFVPPHPPSPLSPPSLATLTRSLPRLHRPGVSYMSIEIS